jgi:hypothetical protein
VVIGELVDLVITDMFGKSLAFWTKVEGNGKFQVLTSLTSCANDRLKLTAVTTSLDGNCLKAESSWALDLPPCVANVSLLDERYKECIYVQVEQSSMMRADVPTLAHHSLETFEANLDSSFLDTSLETGAESHHEGLLPASFPWTDGSRHQKTEDGVYSISSHGLITIVPIIKP